MNQSINTDSKHSKEPQQKYRLGTVSIKILGGLNRFYRRLTSPSASIMAQNIQLFGPSSLRFNIFIFFFLKKKKKKKKKKHTTPIEAIFHVEPSCDGRMKVSINGLYNMNKLVAMPIYGQKLSKSSSLEPKGRWTWNLVCSIEYSSTIKCIQTMPLVGTDLFYGKVKFGPLCFYMEKS